VSAVYDCSDRGQRAEGLSAAAQAVSWGQLVAFPTDTSYGVGADAFQLHAVEALAAAKSRDRRVPVSVLVGSWRGLDGLVLVTLRTVRQLVEAFWPGPLTLIVEHAPSLAWDLGDARGTVAVRMPLHPVALELLAETGPMAVSGANKAGQPPPTELERARDQLGDAVAVYLDAGPCGEPMPSTVVDATTEAPRVLRLGAVSLEQLREVVPDIVGPEVPVG
jgi:tRNA threonylcarbamoyl adenosine modification protein (Sua5/YciO/YrdC/YwlC family)